MKKWLWLLAVPAALACWLSLAQVQALQAAPAATFTVNTTLDLSDDNTGDNLCHTSTNQCSLRAAVQQANNTNGVLIVVPPGVYLLTDTVNADLSLNNGMVISGAGSAATIIQPGVFWSFDLVHVGGGNNVTIKGVTLRYGSNLSGAGGAVSNAGNLTLTDSIVYSNTAVDRGGGIYNHRPAGTARLVLVNSSVTQNRTTDVFSVGGAGIFNTDLLTVTGGAIFNNTTGADGSGGGLYVDAGGSAFLTGTLISANNAFGGGGLMVVAGGALVAVGSSISANHAITGDGGGVDNAGLLTLVGVTVTQNIAPGGGGLFNHNGGKTLMVLGTITANSAAIGAGAFNAFTSAVSLSRLTLDAVSVQHNIAPDHGGGIYNDAYSVLNISFGDVSENSSPGTLSCCAGYGGGISNAGGPVSINGTTLRGNTAKNSGGAISSAGSLTLTAATVISNSADGGGGVETSGRTFIDASTFSGNLARVGAGLISDGPFALHVDIDNSTFSGNVVTASGGAIYANSMHVYLENDTLSGNRSLGDGGGIFTYNAIVDANNLTIAGNTADADNNGSGDGGGVYQGASSSFFFYNTLLGPNTDSGGEAPDCTGELTSHDYNLIRTTLGCSITGTLTHNHHGIIPQLGPLQDNGGLTWTRALLPNSPAINAGNPLPPGGSIACAATDQRGVGRPIDGRCDIGAFESPVISQLFLPLIDR